MDLKIWGPRFSAPGRRGVLEGRSQDHRWGMESQSLGALVLQDPPLNSSFLKGAHRDFIDRMAGSVTQGLAV